MREGAVDFVVAVTWRGIGWTVDGGFGLGAGGHPNILFLGRRIKEKDILTFY
jgi:hypothetical protein